MKFMEFLGKLFENIKDKLLEEIEDPVLQTLIQTCSLAKLIESKPINDTFRSTNQEELSNIINKIIRQWVDVKSNQNRSLCIMEGSINLQNELLRSNNMKPDCEMEIDIPNATCKTQCSLDSSSSGSSESGLDLEGNDDTLEDPELGDRIVTPRYKETADQYLARYPNLPRVRCPKDLFVSTLNLNYLNSLYLVESGTFPVDWFQLKTQDPIQAWRSLNISIVPYFNQNWAQGVNIQSNETAVDNYNIAALKNAIIETVKSATASSTTESSRRQSRPPEGAGSVDLMNRLE